MTAFLPFFRRRPQAAAPARQRGVSVIAAVFLLLLMAGLAAFMANIISATHIGQAADIGGSRAYQAARAGVEWGMYQLDPNAQSAGLPACFATATLTAIPGYSVAVSCTAYPSDSTSYQEGSKVLRVFRIVAKATAPGLVPVEREIQVTLEKCRDSAITTAPYGC